MRYIVILGILICGLTLQSCQESKTNEVEMVTVEEMKSLLQLEDVQLVDVRSNKEYEDGYIKNAKNIVYLGDGWESDIKKLDKKKPVLVYCERGGRSAKCADLLLEAGFEKIYDLKGGIQQWKFSGEAVEN